VPVSNPSAFPPPRAPDQIISINAGENYSGQRSFLAGSTTGDNCDLSDLVLLGHAIMPNATTDTNVAGSTAVGSETLTAFVSSGTGGAGANTALGFRAGGAMIYGAANVFIGDNAAGAVPGVLSNAVTHNVVIGSGACEFSGNAGENQSLSGSVVIGWRACASVNPSTGEVTASVVIGAGAATNTGSGGGVANLEGSVVIGAQTVAGMAESTSVQSVVVVGANCTHGAGPQNSVYVGCNAVVGDIAVQSVVIGDSTLDDGGGFNVAVGDHAHTLAGDFNVLLGSNVGRGIIAATSNALLIEVGAAQSSHPTRRLVFGNFGTQGAADGGTLIFGDSQPGVNDDMQGVNTVKLLNGTIGIASPVGGGYFYVTAGALHWVGSGGTDTAIAPA
jgi:hypothetical protein